MQKYDFIFFGFLLFVVLSLAVLQLEHYL